LRFPKKVKLVFPINQANQLLLMFLDDNQGLQAGFSGTDHKLFDNSQYVLTSVTHETNQNLDQSQREQLLWHHKLGHMNFEWLQALFKHEHVILTLIRYLKLVSLLFTVMHSMPTGKIGLPMPNMLSMPMP
jgi:hypothetical protein